jgi:hypothetical protein
MRKLITNLSLNTKSVLRKYTVGTLCFIIVGLGGFYACKKDTDRTELLPKTQKSTGNYRQPTQIIDINTVFECNGVVYQVVGTAIVGNYDGRIYEFNVSWKMSTGSNAPTVRLTAAIKPEYVPVEPVMDNYTITIIPANAPSAECISALWEHIVEVCNANTVLMDYPEEPTEEYLRNLINLTSFNINDYIGDDYVEGDDIVIDFEEEVIDSNSGMCYLTRVFGSAAEAEAWMASERAAGKTVSLSVDTHIGLVGGKIVVVQYYIVTSWTPPKWTEWKFWPWNWF